MIPIPSPAEKEAMRIRYTTAKQPKPKPLYYQVWQCGCVVYRGDIGLCWYFIRLHALKTKPKAKY